ncbi:MAG: LptA/OstA family protein, partial [Terriglobales bacterium]
APRQSMAAQLQRPSASPRTVTVSADRLLYSSALHRVLYTGGVRLRVADATLLAPQLAVYLSPPGAGAPASKQGLRSATASGGVLVQQPGRSARAQRLHFDFRTEVVRLQGGPPSISDAEQGRITGDPLTFSLTSDEIQVGGKPGTRVLGQTKGRN